MRIAVTRGAIASDGDFLRLPNATIRLRRRNGDPPARIEFISDAEIADAIKHVLPTQLQPPTRIWLMRLHDVPESKR